MSLSPQTAQRLQIPLIALAMSAVMSLALTAAHAGLSTELPLLWLRQWALAFVVALPTALLVVPAVRNALARVTVPSPSVRTPSLPPHGTEAVTRAPSPRSERVAKTADRRLSARLG
jgi:hypothetical protein